MSHLSVAVFSKRPADLIDQLAPFAEEVDGNSPYARFRLREDASIDPIKGKPGYWYNPNAKWDWWEIGGRWRNFLRLLPEKTGKRGSDCYLQVGDVCYPERCDHALVADCDLSPEPDEINQNIRIWERVVEGSPMRKDEKPVLNIFKPEYYLSQYGDKETYAKMVSYPMPYAFITAEGEWHETGSMGWFGLDDATPEGRKAFIEAYEAYLKKAQEEHLYITIVDCHI